MKLWQVWKQLAEILKPRDKRILLALVGFAVFTALMDVAGISALGPFVTIASDFELLKNSTFLQNVYHSSGAGSETQFIVYFGVLVLVIYVLRAISSLLNHYLIARFSHGRYKAMASTLFNNYLTQSLERFNQKNVGELIRAIISETTQLTQLFYVILTIITELCILILLYGLMLLVNGKLTIVLTVFLTLLALLFIKAFSGKMRVEGEKRAEYNLKIYKTLSAAFGSFRLLKLQGNEEQTVAGFDVAADGYASSQIRSQTMVNVPRISLELIGFSLVVLGVLAYVVFSNGSIRPLLPVFAFFVLALYRVLPSVNRLVTSYQQMHYTLEALRIVHDELHQPKEMFGDESISFHQAIRLDQASYHYPDGEQVLDNVSLTIDRGRRVAVVGESGAGKTTFVDILMGLLIPQQGDFLVDDVPVTDENRKSWRSKIGYIPQTIYLFDGSVEENILLGRDKDPELLESVLRSAKADEFIKGKGGVTAPVGDGGSLLSGGQRQRIAIARALYGQPEVLVLDEATSALDKKVEEEILASILELDRNITVIAITHREESIQHFDAVYKVASGSVELFNQRE